VLVLGAGVPVLDVLLLDWLPLDMPCQRATRTLVSK
jgi:hypothetical protein